MEAKRVNTIFSSIIIFSIVSELIIGFFLMDFVDLDNLIVNELIVEALLLIPAIVGILYKRNKEESLSDRLAFHKMKPKAIWATVLCGIVIIPIGTLANAVSLLFTENTVTESSDLYLNQGVMTAMVFVAVVGPFVEEFVFRSVIYKGYRKAGGRMGAVMLSALLFGLMHMNLNQLVYAFVVGMLLALVVEAADSVWASVICHFVFNAENVAVMFLSRFWDPETDVSSIDYGNEDLMELIIMYAFIATIALLIFIVLLRWITNIQGTSENMKEIFSSREFGEKKAKLFSVSLIWGILISVGYIVLYEVMTHL